ncbi:hypothetical protein K438DRAFT_2090171 [Mycena galopus ATCC 62051]|nr:hypothetical protein K438DRAFT_2090171 [Mycena galopus ATCC 62051]
MSARPSSGPGSRGGRVPRGRGGKKAAAAGFKRTPPSDSEYEDTAHPPKKSRKAASDTTVATAAPAPRTSAVVATMASTRVRRVDAGNNMAVLLEAEKPQPKRTHEQVVAADTARAVESEARVCKRADNMSYIASIDAEFDAARAAEEADAIDDMADLPADAMEEVHPEPRESEDKDEEMLDITEESFERIEDDNAYLSTSEWDKPPVAKGKKKAVAAPVKQTKKPGKGETRKEIEALGKQLATNTTAAVKKKGVQNSNAAAASAKAGLSKSWPATSTGSSTIGGLTDEDANAVRPDFEAPETVRAPRKNDVVALVSDSDSDNTPSKVPAPIKAALKARAHAAVKVEAGAPKIPALAVRSRKVKASIVKTESLSSSFTPFTPESSRDVNGLPAFIAKTWITRFLPELFKLLYCSLDPMALGAVGDDLEDPGRATINILQPLLDRLYPGTKWVLEWGDVICARAVKRLRDCRCAFAKIGARLVNASFEEAKYYSDKKLDQSRLRLSKTIANDAKYAVRSNGPAFWKTPTPQAVGLLKRDNPAYIKPVGYLESPAIVKTVLTFIGKQEWPLNVSVGNKGQEVISDISGLPIGALGMGAASVERGYRLHVTGFRTKPQEFSAANYGTAVNGFIAGIMSFTPSRWESIFAACGAAISEPILDAEDSSEVEEETLDGVREAISPRFWPFLLRRLQSLRDPKASLDITFLFTTFKTRLIPVATH